MKSLALSTAITIACVFGTAGASAESNHANPAVGSATANSKSKFTDDQLAEIQARLELANRISRSVEEDARNSGAPDNWRGTLMNTLLGIHSATLRDIAGNARSLFDARTQASQAITQGRPAKPAVATADALGSSTDSLVYTPMTPCRFVDTRNVGGPIGTTPRQFDTEKDGSLYGGISGCTVPGAGEPAIAANVTLVAPATSAGYLAVRPAGSTNATSWLNFNQSGATVAVANQGVISTAVNTDTGHYLFEVLVVGGPANVLIDYFGYFSQAAATPLDCVGTTVLTVSLPANSNNFYPAPACPSGYVVTAPYCYNNLDAGVYSSGSGLVDNGPSNSAFCAFINQNSTAASVGVGATCCRVP